MINKTKTDENNQEKKPIVWFEEVDKDDISLVGGKGANLGEMIQAGFPIPEGFIITSDAYFTFLNLNNFQIQIKRILETVDVHDPQQHNEVSQKIKKLIISGEIPHYLAKQIISFYEKLGGRLKKHCLVACRSSATAEDLPDASFAGQQETFLNIKGEANLVNKVRECWASLFTPRAIFYRREKNFDHFRLGLCVIVQKMIQADTSGVIFTVDPVTNDKTKIIIEGIYGLGELIVQGSVTPDHYEVNKNNLKIITKQINDQKIKLIKVGTLNKKTKVKTRLSNKQKISDNKIIELATMAKKIHQHYFFPQDIEWVIEKGRIYIVQTRPVTTFNQKKRPEKELKINLPLIIKGDPAGPGIAVGYARVVASANQIAEVHAGEVLITKMTTPDFVPAMKRAVAIVTDEGGQTSHAAIVSRELGIPCVVGTKNATKLIKNGLVLTVNGSTGEIFKGSPAPTSRYSSFQNQFKATSVAQSLNQAPSEILVSHLKTATKLYVNLAEPDLAETIAKRNVDGVGLLRAEFMISQHIKYHPKKLIEDKKQVFFVDKLAEGIAKFCRVFDPRPVIYRATDFKTNEYGNLIGGKFFEPAEQNPMIGFRGAFRYLHQSDVFKLELEAIKKVRNKLDLKNLWLMIPFVRTVEELAEVKKLVNQSGLTRGGSFDLWMMVEIPSNVVLLEKFIEVGIDGVSIGSNDLTMLVLGADRDNSELKEAFDERNEAVLWFFEKTIKTCLKHKVSCSICGQAPSIYPDLTAKLVNWGINSVSVSPDMIEMTREIIYEAEKRRVNVHK